MSQKFRVDLKIYVNKNDEKNYQQKYFICDSYKEEHTKVIFTNTYTVDNSEVPFLPEYNELVTSLSSKQSQLYTMGHYPSQITRFEYYKVYPSVIINQCEVLSVYELDDLEKMKTESLLYQEQYDKTISLLKDRLEKRLKHIEEQKNKKNEELIKEPKISYIKFDKQYNHLKYMISKLQTAYKMNNFESMQLAWIEQENKDA
jgi:hypothetical protein